MKVRTPGTVSAAINEIKNKLSEKECAKLLDRSESLIRRWANPDDPSLPNLRQCLALDAAYIQAGFGKPPIQSWYTECLERIANDDPKVVDSIVLTTLHAQAAIGQLSSMIAQLAERNGDDADQLSSNEQAMLLELITNLSSNLDELEDAIQSRLQPPPSLSLSKFRFK